MNALIKNIIEGMEEMYKKSLIVATTIGLLVMGSTVHSEALEPIYDQDGNLILDMEQDSYQDLSSEEVKEPETDNTEVEVKPVTPSVPEAKPTVGDSKTIKNSEVKVETKTQTVNKYAATAYDTNTETALGTMLPASATYMAGSNTVVASKGNLKITKVEVEYVQGLPANSWNIAGDTLTFDTKKLDTAHSGIYTFKVYFEGGSESIYELKILDVPKLNDYWQQNIDSYSKNPKSNTHKDLELISSSQSLTVSSITIGSISVPSSQYKIIGGTVIISKSFLSQLEPSERSRVTVTYNNGLVVDFSLAITDYVEKGNSTEQVDC